MINTLSSIRDQEIVASLLRYEERGLSLLYQNYSSSINGVIHRIVRSDDVAAEVLNDVFLKVFNNIASFDENKSKLYTWIARIARNASIDKLRSAEYKKKGVTSSMDANPFLENSSVTNESMDYINLSKILEVLDNDTKRMVEMIYLEGYTYDDCGSELEVPVSTVKTKVRRALMKLRTFLKDDINTYMSLWIVILFTYLIQLFK